MRTIRFPVAAVMATAVLATRRRSRRQNGVVGKVTTTDGRLMHLSTRAKYIVFPDGSEDLQQLWVKYGG